MNEEERLKAQAALVQMQDKYFMFGFDKAIDKACEWLDKVNTDNYMDSGIFQMSELISDFRKAMKGK